jgi:hypothetical protein
MALRTNTRTTLRRSKNQKALMLFLLCGVMLLVLVSGLGVVMQLAAVPQDVRGQASTISDLNLIANNSSTEKSTENDNLSQETVAETTAETLETLAASESSQSTKSGQITLNDIKKNQPIGVTFILVLLGLGLLIGGLAVVAIHFISKFGAA